MKTNFIIITLLFLFGCKTSTPTTSQQQEKEEKSEEVKKNPASKEPKSAVNLDTKIGQMILVGINDRKTLSRTDTLIKEIESNKMGGIILFEKNIAPENSKETLKDLISDLQSYAETPLFISIDEEGGSVHRLKEKYGFVGMPSASYLGTLNNGDSTYYYTDVLADQLSELGINFNFAPTVDLALNADNPVIAKVGRSYSHLPEVVTYHAENSIKAHHENEVLTILKHFPGHGSSTTDSHYGITEVTDQWKIIELMPYKNLIKSGTVDAVMTAHIVNCHLDLDCLPATLSKTVITGILRNLLDFEGVVISDDMQMYAISKNYGLENAIEMSINAGVDILLFGNNVNQKDRISATEIHAIVKNLVEQGRITEDRINESYQRIMELKQKQKKL